MSAYLCWSPKPYFSVVLSLGTRDTPMGGLMPGCAAALIVILLIPLQHTISGPHNFSILRITEEDFALVLGLLLLSGNTMTRASWRAKGLFDLHASVPHWGKIGQDSQVRKLEAEGDAKVIEECCSFSSWPTPPAF